jgi:hypothetical protein
VKRSLVGILCQLTLAIAVTGTGLGQKPDKCAELPDCKGGKPPDEIIKGLKIGGK